MSNRGRMASRWTWIKQIPLTPWGITERRVLREHWMLLPLTVAVALIAVVLLLGAEGWPHRMIGALVTVILTVAHARNTARA